MATPAKKADTDETTDDASTDATAAVTTEETSRLDETVPGGRYIVNGVAVNADGNPIKE